MPILISKKFNLQGVELRSLWGKTYNTYVMPN
jgi:hypothetical protein